MAYMKLDRVMYGKNLKWRITIISHGVGTQVMISPKDLSRLGRLIKNKERVEGR